MLERHGSSDVWHPRHGYMVVPCWEAELIELPAKGRPHRVEGAVKRRKQADPGDAAFDWTLWLRDEAGVRSFRGEKLDPRVEDRVQQLLLARDQLGWMAATHIRVNFLPKYTPLRPLT